MNELGNHLWQSTIFAAAVAVAAFLLRKNRARVRYWLWLAASVKFLVPFSVLMSFGSRLDVPAATALPALPALTVEQITTSFAPVFMPPQPTVRWWPWAMGAIWLVGALVLMARWTRSWLELQRLRRRARQLPTDFPVPVLEAPAAIEPGVFGLFRPVLLLPGGLADRLTPEQMNAVLSHELAHIEARDNLTAALHVAVSTLFWFHPGVWWIGRRLIEERELACDESVLRRGNLPETYAQSILNICRFYRETPLPCASGVTGADLKRRIREIMASPVSLRLTLTRKALLAVAGVAALSVPLVIGILRAQTLPPEPAYTYEVVSIKRNNSGDTNSLIGPGPQGGLRGKNVTAMLLLTTAFDARDYQFVDAPGWVNSERFDFEFTPDRADVAPSPAMAREQTEAWFNRSRHRLRAVLRDRFGLVLRAEKRELPMFALTVDRKGAKLKPAANPGQMQLWRTHGPKIAGKSASMKMLSDSLADIVGRYVANETDLDELYDFELVWTETQVTPDAAEASTPAGGVSLYTALTEQLGLKLVAKRGPVPVFVVEKVEKPSEN